MTGTPDPPPTRPLKLGGQPIHQVLRRQAPKLARSLGNIIAEEVPTYHKMHSARLYNGIVAIIELNLTMVAEMFERREPPTVEDLEPMRAAAGRGAHDKVPLEDILTAYHLGGRRAMETLFSECDPADHDDVLAAYSLILRYNQSVSAAVCSGYSHEREAMLSQEQDARHSVVSALLNGERPISAGALAGVRLAAHYLVLTVAIEPHPDEMLNESTAGIAGRRKLGRIRAVLNEFASAPVLSVLDVAGGLILVPLPEEDRDWGHAEKLVESMSLAAKADIRAAGEPAGIEDVPQAAKLTQEVLDVVRDFDRAPGLYRLSDVLLEYQLTRPSQAVAELAELLKPLEDNPDLQHTLDVYLANGLNRRRTAELLHIHANSVDYRLSRIAQLTGLDPTNPNALQRINAAMAARRGMQSKSSD